MSSSVAELLARGLTGSSWTLLIVSFVICAQLTILSVTLYLHRSQAHRGVDFHPALAHFFRFWTWLTTAMVTKEWVAIHRKHHARCETEEDPHSPLIHGIGKVAVHGVVLYQQACKDRAMIDKYGLGCPDDWIERNVYSKYSAGGPTLMLFIALAAGGAAGLAWWALLMLVIPVGAAGMINGVGHWWGYRNFETGDLATNLTPWAFILGGEELHNNHHAFPSSAKFALRKFEFDIGWVVLRALEKLKLARIIRVAPQLELRPWVDLPDTETVKAVIEHRFEVAKSYFRNVTLPVLRQERLAAGKKAQRLAARLRRALANDGRWLDPNAREKLRTWVGEHPALKTVLEYRARLDAVLARSREGSEAMLASLQEWCRDAEASGIEALQAYAQRLRGYSVAPAAVPA